MSDLLIVRMSDRSKARYARSDKTVNMPVGMHFGLVAGAGLSLVFLLKTGSDPLLATGLGVAIGLAFGGILGRLLKPRRPYRRSTPDYSYSGMPFTEEEEASEREASQAESDPTPPSQETQA